MVKEIIENKPIIEAITSDNTKTIKTTVKGSKKGGIAKTAKTFVRKIRK